MADHQRLQPEILFVRCEEGLTGALEKAAEADGRSLSDWVRRALRGCAGLPVQGPPKKSAAKRSRSTNNRRKGLDRGKQ